MRGRPHVSHECRFPSGGLDLVNASQQLSSALHAQILEGHLRVGGRFYALGQPLVDGHQQEGNRQSA